MNKPHVHAEFIKAWADGATIQYSWQGSDDWFDVCERVSSWSPSTKYRIKPEVKPDQVVFAHIGVVGTFTAVVQSTSSYNWNEPGGHKHAFPANAKLVFDGETGKLKSVELI